jgi:hypothetical protein
MANSIPNSGRAVMRNRRTGAAWLVTSTIAKAAYWHEPQGNLRHIRRHLLHATCCRTWYQPGRINRAYQRTNLTELSGSHYGAGILTTKFQGKP